MRWLTGLVFAAIVVGHGASARGDILPPSVTIYDINWNQPDTMTVEPGELFTLYGVATGASPLVYRWYVREDGTEPVFVAESFALIDFSIDLPGEYDVVLVVVDTYGQAGQDSVTVTVVATPVGAELRTWGAIKRAYH
jgi:hypothetical protein